MENVSLPNILRIQKWLYRLTQPHFNRDYFTGKPHQNFHSSSYRGTVGVGRIQPPAAHPDGNV